MQQLIQSLSDYAFAGHWVPVQEEISFSGLVESTRADRIQLKQLLQHLILNAIRYKSPERSPRLSISGEITADEWHITVDDNGQGISPEGQAQCLTCLHAFTAAMFERAASDWRSAGGLWRDTAAGSGWSRTDRAMAQHFTSLSLEMENNTETNPKRLETRYEKHPSQRGILSTDQYFPASYARIQCRTADNVGASRNPSLIRVQLCRQALC
jgi:Histidine kinase-, DNA gyrase B-, and HSP90-like ATPase